VGGPPSVLVIDGPPAPQQPNGMARDEATGKSTIRAIKLQEPLNFDGRLDDLVYESTAGFGGMLQASPRYGEPSTERTDIWVMFDGDNIYVAAKCYDAAPPERWIANELRRDTNQMRQNGSLRRRLRHLLRSPQRLHVLRQSAGRLLRLLRDR
jgi:hypothetical protein